MLPGWKAFCHYRIAPPPLAGLTARSDDACVLCCRWNYTQHMQRMANNIHVDVWLAYGTPLPPGPAGNSATSPMLPWSPTRSPSTRRRSCACRGAASPRPSNFAAVSGYPARQTTAPEEKERTSSRKPATRQQTTRRRWPAAPVLETAHGGCPDRANDRTAHQRSVLQWRERWTAAAMRDTSAPLRICCTEPRKSAPLPPCQHQRRRQRRRATVIHRGRTIQASHGTTTSAHGTCLE